MQSYFVWRSWSCVFPERNCCIYVYFLREIAVYVCISGVFVYINVYFLREIAVYVYFLRGIGVYLYFLRGIAVYVYFLRGIAVYFLREIGVYVCICCGYKWTRLADTSRHDKALLPEKLTPLLSLHTPFHTPAPYCEFAHCISYPCSVCAHHFIPLPSVFLICSTYFIPLISLLLLPSLFHTLDLCVLTERSRV